MALVIVHHITTFSTLHVYFYRYSRTVERLEELGRFGVLIFFCISGFVICRGLIQERSSPKLTLAAFYFRRALRILPPLMLYLAAIAIFSFTTKFVHASGSQILKGGTFICNLPLAGYCGWFVGHTWSLAYEEQFYLIFPLLFLLLGLAARPNVLLVIIGLLGCSALLFSVSNNKFYAYYVSMFIYMLCGCAAALYWSRLRSFLKKVPVIIWLIVTLITFALAGTLPFASVLNQVKQTIVMPLLICFVVLGTPTRDCRVKAIFENPAISYFGKMSYTVYLWQQLATANYLAAPPWLAFVLLCAVFLFAYYSYEYLERPLMRLGANWSNKIKGRTVSGAPLAI